MNRRRHYIPTIVSVFCIVTLPGAEGAGQPYASAMRALLSQAGKVDVQRYQFLPVPTARFGIGTMYPLDSTREDFDLAVKGIYGDPGSWWVTLSDNDRLTAMRAIVRVGEAPSMSLNGRQTTTLTLAEVFPQVLNTTRSILDLTRVSVSVTASGAQNRFIDWLEMDDAVNLEHLFKASIAEHAAKRDFVMTTADLVLEGFEVHIPPIKGGADATTVLESTLTALVRQSQSPFSMERQRGGGYSLKSAQSIVAAICVTLPPKMPWAEVGDRRLPALSTPGLLRQITKAEVMGATPTLH